MRMNKKDQNTHSTDRNENNDKVIVLSLFNFIHMKLNQKLFYI